MSDATFKTAVVETESVPEPYREGEKQVAPNTDAEIPFTEYKNFNKLPYTAEYMGLKLTWDESVMVDDVEAIESYLQRLVRNGELDNTTKAAQKMLKKMEKMANTDTMEGQAMRLIKLAEYARYLEKINERKYDRN